MKKIRLDPEALDVYSFATLPEQARSTGTIRGHYDAYVGKTEVPATAPPHCTNDKSCMEGGCHVDSAASWCLCEG